MLSVSVLLVRIGLRA